jgi:uncharacterized protein (TIRG00374 family)
MNQKTIKNIIQITLSLALGIFIFWYVYKDQNLGEMISELSHTHIIWLIIPMIIALLSHFIRAVRWKMLLDPLGKKVNVWNVFGAVLVAYFMNYIFPRAGEVVRCGVLKQCEKVPFSEALGTVIVERSVDLIVELLAIILAVALQYDMILLFFEKHNLTNGLLSLINNPWLWISGVLIVVILFLFRKRLAQTGLYHKVIELGKNIWRGIKSISRMENKGLFIFYSIMIFVCYYLMYYLCFFAFDFLDGYGPLCGLAGFIMGSFGIIAPVQGGLGAWHFMVINTMTLYGLGEYEAGTFAFIVHGGQTILQLISGFIALIALNIFNKRRKTIL